MTLSMVHARPDAGVTVAEINLKFIWELISQNDADKRGQALRGRFRRSPDCPPRYQPSLA